MEMNKSRSANANLRVSSQLEDIEESKSFNGEDNENYGEEVEFERYTFQNQERRNALSISRRSLKRTKSIIKPRPSLSSRKGSDETTTPLRMSKFAK